MAKVILKKVCDSSKYGRRLKTATFEIIGNPSHVLAFKEVTKKSKKPERGKGSLNKNYLPPFLLEREKAYRTCDSQYYALFSIRGV